MKTRNYGSLQRLLMTFTIIVILFMACDRKDSNATGKQYKGTSTGYDGEITVKATITKDGYIEAIRIDGNDKNSELGGPAISTIAKEILSKQDASVDAVSGATQTSNGVIEATKNAFEKAGITNP